MRFSLLFALIVAAFALFAIYSLLKADQRRWDRRRGRLFAPIQRRKKARRKTGFLTHLAWAIRSQLSRFGRPKEKAKPLRKPRRS